jgi:hypothetical protein
MPPGLSHRMVRSHGIGSEISFLHRRIQLRTGIATRRRIQLRTGIAARRRTLFARQFPGNRRRSPRQGKQCICMWIG